MSENQVLVIDKDTLQQLLEKALDTLAAQRAQDHEELMSAGAAVNTLVTAALEAGIRIAGAASEAHVAADCAHMAAMDARATTEESNRHEERMYALETERQTGGIERERLADEMSELLHQRIDGKVEDALTALGERMDAPRRILERINVLESRMNQHEQFGNDD
jgi:hypothetical protein